VQNEVFPWLTTNVSVAVYVLPFSYFDAFAIGGFFALYGRSFSARFLWGFFALIVFVGIATSALFEPRLDIRSLGYSGFMANSYKYVWGYTLFNLLFGMMIVSLRDANPKRGFLVHPVMVYLGTITYGLYVFHNGVLWFVTAVMLPDSSKWITVPLVFVLTVLFSAASFKYVESPCLNMKDRFFPTK
jgi:peptidoglycan/LPS O-acetylase OafA/YrhL